ncbi:hypothetical protein ABE083_01000 [Bacillus mycoides]|uniref:Uncharacterized protein n=1 Tax=Bacillus mycoides TaxID=1405 RepID=A0A1S9T9V4_BACMY|nr:hypothetical protein [Bacillus mycoides]OOR06499.1 hypothetical protein BW900_11825 [Bacillus mycoides]
MDTVYEDFLNTVSIMDDLSLEGFYGNSIKMLVEKRDTMNTPEYLTASLEIWLQDKQQYGKKIVVNFINTFFKLYTNALNTDSKKTLETLTSFWRGTKNSPELENLSAYFELSRSNQETKQFLKLISQNQKPSIAEKHQAAKLVSSTYSKGIEFIGKTLTTCIILQKISNKESYDFFEIDSMTVFNKVKTFNTISNNQYQDLTKTINRSIRNAEAHLNLTFNHKDATYTLRKKVNKKIIQEKISFEKMMMEIFPNIGWYTQGFVYSGSLLSLAFENQEKFKSLVKEIQEV